MLAHVVMLGRCSIINHYQMLILSHLPKSSIKSSTLSLANSLDWCGRHRVSHNAPVEYKRPCSCYFHQSRACWRWPTAIRTN